MIPIQLTLRNFLSYREATLDFRGLHTACICGANGAGKSSLLEAISWAIWGESRAAVEDDVIHQGQSEARVDFSFSLHNQTYRIIRTRYRGQAMTLDFQIQSNPETGLFRPLTGKNLRSTQQLIVEQLNLDYDTFINSAYLRQGRADEFMLKRPGDRKQILADLLKLQPYEDLAEKARDQTRQLKGQMAMVEKQIQSIQTQLQAQDSIDRQRATVEAQIADLQQRQIAGRQALQILQTQQQQRQGWQQQFGWQQQQFQAVNLDVQRLQRSQQEVEQQWRSLQDLFAQEPAICAGYSQWQNFQAQEEFLSSRYQIFQAIQAQRQTQQQQQQEKHHAQQQQEQAVQQQLTTLVEQQAALDQILSRREEVEAGLAQLHQARTQLQHYDQAQLQASPLVQRQQQLQRDIDRATTRLTTRLDELRQQAQQLQRQQARQPVIQEAVTAVADRIEALDKLRKYQEQVREKGVERRTFMERLQAHQRAYESQLAEVDQILRLLNTDAVLTEVEISTVLAPELQLAGRVQEADGDYHAESYTETQTITLVEKIAIAPFDLPACPLCDRPLDEHHRQLVLTKHKAKQQEILNQIWVIRDQLAASEREIQVLRQEYRTIETRLSQYGEVMQERGQLQAQLQSNTEVHQAFDALMTELAAVENQLRLETHLTEYQEEQALLENSLTQLNYDERDHALARGWVDRWRWAEIKHQDIKQALKQQAQLRAQQPQLVEQAQALQAEIAQLERETVNHLGHFDQQLATIGYSLEQHNDMRSALRQAQVWQLKYQDLQQSRQHFPQVQQRLDDVVQALQGKLREQQTIQQQLDFFQRCLSQNPDAMAQVQQGEAQMQADRLALDAQLAELGRLQQQQQQQELLRTQAVAAQTQQQQLQQQLRIYQELTQAFGKNGIPALMIENVLPQLETMTNQILARLSRNQLHVQFVTQRFRQGKSKSQTNTTKAIETLDILIADAKGTRPYETYSGGEAFRINFAIRLALARLLSQRSGTALQMLIVDEGFGTQDQEGIDRLITAINAIASDFACILTITHMAYFRDAFQSRIEVHKTDTGSHIELCM